MCSADLFYNINKKIKNIFFIMTGVYVFYSSNKILATVIISGSKFIYSSTLHFY